MLKTIHEGWLGNLRVFIHSNRFHQAASVRFSYVTYYFCATCRPDLWKQVTEVMTGHG